MATSADATYAFRRGRERSFLARHACSAEREALVHRAVIDMLGCGAHSARGVLRLHHALARACICFPEAAPTEALALAEAAGLVHAANPMRTHLACTLAYLLGDAPTAVACERSTYEAATKPGIPLAALYKPKVVRILTALRGNELLRGHILDGSVPPGDIGHMSSEQLWPGRVPKPRDSRVIFRLADFSVQNSLLACVRCKRHTVDYTERQTRSADEPTTKFCFCTSCSMRWRFC